MTLQQRARDRLREFLKACDGLSHGAVHDLVDRLEIAGKMGALLVRRQVDEYIERRREGDGAIRAADLHGLQDTRDTDLVQPKRVRDLLALDILRDGINPARLSVRSD